MNEPPEKLLPLPVLDHHLHNNLLFLSFQSTRPINQNSIKKTNHVLSFGIPWWRNFQANYLALSMLVVPRIWFCSGDLKKGQSGKDNDMVMKIELNPPLVVFVFILSSRCRCAASWSSSDRDSSPSWRALRRWRAAAASQSAEKQQKHMPIAYKQRILSCFSFTCDSQSNFEGTRRRRRKKILCFFIPCIDLYAKFD